MSVRVQMASSQQQQPPAVAVRIPDRSQSRASTQMMMIANSDHSSTSSIGSGISSGHHKPRNFPYGGGRPKYAPDPNATTEYDGRRLRKSLVRKTVDYNAAIIKGLQNRVWQRDYGDRRALEPDYSYAPDTVPPSMLLDNPTNAVTTRYVKSATNKMRCPIFSMAWTPEGRRLITGASSGEFTLWNGLTFNFETILQAHDSPVRSMIWSHNDVWMVTGDHAGYVKYWQSNMNNVKMFQAHKEAIRGLTFSPSDQKFASCSDDGTVRIWDFYTCYEEKVLRGHGADVKCVDWHPHKSLVASGSKDNQQPVKIWDAKSGIPLATLHAHKSTVMDARWNKNGNWLVTASRDHLVKLFDIRKLSQEFQVFRGHKKEASCVSWHPIHEELFVSGGSDGSILFWNVGCDKEVGSIEAAHDNIIWSLAWHPVGHILCSGSNDHTSKFWTRQKPGDIIRDRTHGGPNFDYSQIEDNEMEEIIPGMGPEDKIDMQEEEPEPVTETVIPGLDITEAEQSTKAEKQAVKKTPYQKPIPKKFQAIWNDTKVEQDDELDDDKDKIRNTLLPKPGDNTPSTNTGKPAQQQQQQQQQQQPPSNASNGSGIRNERSDTATGGSNMSQQQKSTGPQANPFGVFNPNVGFGNMDLHQYGMNSNPMSGGPQRGPAPQNQSPFQQSGPTGPSPFLNPSPNPFAMPPSFPPQNMPRMMNPQGMRGPNPNQMNRMMMPRNPDIRGGGGWNR